MARPQCDTPLGVKCIVRTCDLHTLDPSGRRRPSQLYNTIKVLYKEASFTCGSTFFSMSKVP